MRISEIKSSSNPYIGITKNEKQLIAPIDLIEYDIKNELIKEHTLCFNTTTLKVGSKILKVKWDDPSIKYDLFCKSNKSLFKWEDVDIRPLDDAKGFSIFASEAEGLEINPKKQLKEKKNKEKQFKREAKQIRTKEERKRNEDDVTYNLGLRLVASLCILSVVCGFAYTHDLNTCKTFIAETFIENYAEGSEITAGSAAILNQVSKVQSETIPDEETPANVDDRKPIYCHDNKYDGKRVIYAVLKKEEYSPRLVSADGFSSVASLVESEGATIGISGSAWGYAGDLDFTFADGKWISDKNTAYQADTLIFANNRLSCGGWGYVDKEAIDLANPTWVLTGYDAVIFNRYNDNTSWDTALNRAFIGQLSNGNYIVGVMEEATYEDLVKWARSLWNYNINILYNLNGGDYCGFYNYGKTIYEGQGVRNAIVF